jgi:hypothetical protein
MHQIAFYMTSWARKETTLDFEVFDALSGASLDHRSFSDIEDGVYAIYNIRRQVYVHIHPPSIYTNAEIYGIFVDPAHVWPVQINPQGGRFSGKTQVSLSTLTPGAQIYFTTDGSNPTLASPRYSGPFWINSDSTIKAFAFKDGFDPTPVAEAAFQDSLLNLVTLIRTDDETSGAWIGHYGTEGYWVPTGGKSISGYAEASLDGASEWIWSDNTSDSRAAFLAMGGLTRQATTWYAPDSFTLNVNVFDTKMHSVALYFLDWDQAGRQERIEILDPVGNVKESLTIDNFQSGRYVVLAIQGQLRIRVTRLQGGNAVLNGLFFDPVPQGLLTPKPVPLTDFSAENGLLRFNIEGFPGQTVYTDRSRDLHRWECIATNILDAPSIRITVPTPTASASEFFRTHF